MKSFGWQGGTIHQVAQETGCDSFDLLYSTPGNNVHYELGKNLYPKLSKHQQEQYRKNVKGNLDFWLGVAEGYKG